MNGKADCCFPNARQCAATSKRTRCRCRAPAVTGSMVCRFHGARGGAPTGAANGAYRSGRYTQDALATRAYVRHLLRSAGELERRILSEWQPGRN
jgi:hypothetical protein